MDAFAELVARCLCAHRPRWKVSTSRLPRWRDFMFRVSRFHQTIKRLCQDFRAVIRNSCVHKNCERLTNLCARFRSLTFRFLYVHVQTFMFSLNFRALTTLPYLKQIWCVHVPTFNPHVKKFFHSKSENLKNYA